MNFTELKNAQAKEVVILNGCTEKVAVLKIAQDIKRLSGIAKILEVQENYDNALITKIETKILKENARYILYYYVLKIMQEVLTKYSGKPYGEKTREKIAKEIETKTECRVYLRSNGFDIFPNISAYGCLFDYHDFYGYTKYNAERGEDYKLLIDNKINVLSDDLLYICPAPKYTEDTSKKAYDIWCAFNRLKEDYKDFETKCAEFNALLPYNIDYIYLSHFRNYLL